MIPSPVRSTPAHWNLALVGSGVAIGIVFTVVLFYALGGQFVGPSSPSPTTPPTVLCPTGTEASIGNSTAGGPPVEAATLSVGSHAWAVGATSTVVTEPMPVVAGSTLLVFVGFVGGSIGGPGAVTVCDSSGDQLFLQASTSDFSSNHTETLFLGLDAIGGNSVSFAAAFSDTAAPAGGTLAVVDLVGPGAVKLANVTAGSTVGVSGLSEVPMNASSPALVVFGVAGQGHDGPFGPVGAETLLDTYGYYDVGPWTDGESFGTLVSSAPAGPVDPGASLATGGVWDAIAAIVN